MRISEKNKLLCSKILGSIIVSWILADPAPLLAKPLVYICVTICVFVGYDIWQK